MFEVTIVEATCQRCWDNNHPQYNPSARGWAQITCQKVGSRENVVTEGDQAGDLCPECFDSFMRWFENKPKE